MEKLFFCDLETTGTNPEENGIHQIGGLVEIRGELLDEFSLNVRPFKEDKIDEKALKISGVTSEQLFSYPEPRAIYGDLIGRFQTHVDRFSRHDKFFFVGFNCFFDYSFLRRFFLKNGDSYFGSWIFWPIIDVAVLAMQFLGGRRKAMSNFRLETVAESLGVEVEGEAHDALHDVRTTHEIYKKIIQRPGCSSAGQSVTFGT